MITSPTLVETEGNNEGLDRMMDSELQPSRIFNKQKEPVAKRMQLNYFKLFLMP